MPAEPKPKKPTVEYYWSPSAFASTRSPDFVVNVRVKASNGLIVGQITQGFKDKRDARRGVTALAQVFLAGVVDHHVDVQDLADNKFVRETGPGPKPKGLL